MSGRISVITAAYNAKAHIEEALASIIDQEMKDIEIIVVDDGSTDRTSKIVEAFASGTPDGLAVRLVTRDRNEGLAAARNTAIAQASGEYLLFLDADDALAKGALVALLARIENEPAARLVFPRYRWMDEAGRCTGVSSPIPREPVGLSTILFQTPIHSDSGVLVRRGDLEAVGSFDTELTGYVGGDMWIRFAIRFGDGALAFEPEATVRYRRHERQITADWRRMDRNWNVVLKKLDRAHPRAIAPFRERAVAQHRLFCAVLAYQTGEYQAARRLLRSALAAYPALPMISSTARKCLLACMASLLPARLHNALRNRFV